MEEVLVVISCFVNIILWLFLFFYFKKKFSSQEILENIRQEVDKLLIEISRETDRDLTLVDDKVKELKELIENADQRIKTIKKEQRKHKKEEASSFGVQEVFNRTEPTMMQSSVYSMENVVSRYVENRNSGKKTVAESEINYTDEERRNIPPSVRITQKTFAPVSDIEKNDKPVREKVLELWKLGMEPELIAEKLTVSLTEIRMIIDMYG